MAYSPVLHSADSFYTLSLPPSLSVEQSAALAERDRLQPWESLATAGDAAADREVVIDECAAIAGVDGRSDW